MKNLLMLILLLSMQSCINFTSPDAGEVVVLVKKPWIFGTGGVSKEPLGTGLHWKVWSTDAITFNIKPFQIVEKFDDLVTLDNVPVDFDAYLQVQIQSEKTPILLDKFGEDWYSTKIQQRFRETIRSYSKSQPVFMLTTNAKILDEIAINTLNEITEYTKKENVPVNILKVVIGRVTPPEGVVKQTVETATQKQRVKTEKERAKAEIARKEAEGNKAIADKEYAKQFGMTTQQYLQLRTLEVIEKKENVQIIMSDINAVKLIK